MPDPTPANTSPLASKFAKRTVGVAVALLFFVAALLLLLLTLSTTDRDFQQNYHKPLFWLSSGLAVWLVGLVVVVAFRVWAGLQSQRFGSKLLSKLGLIFALLGIVPGSLIYFVSYQFVSRSIESWFDVKVESALQSGLQLAQASLEQISSDFSARNQVAANQLSEVSDLAALGVLTQLQEQSPSTEFILWDAQLNPIAHVGGPLDALQPLKPTAAIVTAAKQTGTTITLTGLDDALPSDSGATNMSFQAALSALTVVPNSGYDLRLGTRFLQANQNLSPTFTQHALAINQANVEYQERALARNGLRQIYISTLTLSLVLAVLTALLMAIALGNQLAKPLLLLAQGVREVASGDLRPKAILAGADELGDLTRSFSIMTQQLLDARTQQEQTQSLIRAESTKLQTILDNLSTGILLLTPDGLIQLINPGACKTLQISAQSAPNYQSLLAHPKLAQFGKDVLQQFALHAQERHATGQDHWQQSMILESIQSGSQHITPHFGASSPASVQTHLMVRGAILPGLHAEDSMWLLVLDDVSHIVSAQRAQAWADVARRMAHEVKNPLTPIQLSAQRLEHKLSGKLDPSSQQLLERSVNTIVEQVEALKRLVNEFRDYARLPMTNLQSVNLNSLLHTVLDLYDNEMYSEGLHVELAPDCPEIMADPAQIRQVIHNLLQNAHDANMQVGHSGITLQTQWIEQAGYLSIRINDHGPGFPAQILQRAFEPYITTKARGTGLGLAVVKKIMDEHSAKITISNLVDSEGAIMGAQVTLAFPTVWSPDKTVRSVEVAPP